MSEGQFWFVMICLIVAMDCIVWLERRKLDKEQREYWRNRDRESQQRHEHFMSVLDRRPE